MTVSWQTSTGVSTTGAAKGTTSTTVAYVGVAAGRAAILTVGCKPDTGTIATPSGWTKIGEQTGGTGATGADVGLTKVAMYYKILTGSESGSVTVTGTSTTSIQGAMDVFNKTLGNWDVDSFVSGNDSSHAANRSAVCGAWSNDGLTVNDQVLMGWSGDTDDSTTAISARSITQTGVTFNTPTARSEVRNTSGNQSHTYTVQAGVTAAATPSASAPTAGFTWSVSSCGPVMVVRLRDYDSLSNLTEDFSATLDSTKWGSGGTFSVSGGVGTFLIEGYTYISSLRPYSLPVGGTAVLQVTSYPPTGTTYYFGMRVGPQGNGGSNFVGMYAHGDGTISFEQTGNPLVSLTLDETAMRWWRIRRDASNVLVETSPNGTTWTTRGTLDALPAWVNYTSLEVSIEGAEGGTGGTGLVDNFNLPPNTTPVSQTLDLRWRSYTTVSQSLDLRWRSIATTPVSQTLDLRWRSYTPVATTLDLRWRSSAQVSATLDLRWRSYARVTSDIDLRWRSAARISQTLDLRWKVYQPVTQTISLQWRVYQQVIGGLDLRWRSAGAVSQTLDLRWRVAARVSQTLDLRWRSYLAITPATLDLRWRSLGRVSADLDLRWKAAGTVSQVLDLRWHSYVKITPATLDLRWRTYSPTSQTLDLRWRSYLRVSQTLDLRWKSAALVQQTLDLRWKVYNSVSQSLDLRWRTTGRVSSDLDLRWRQLSSLVQISQTLDLRWRSAARVSSDLDLRWRTYTPMSATIQLLWRSYQKVAPEDRYLIWRSYARVTNDLDLRWRTRVMVSQDLDLRWRSLGRVTADLDVRWRTIGRVSQTLDLRWKSYGQITATLDLRWRVASKVSASLDLRWRTIGRVSQTLVLSWRTLALTQATTTDLFIVERNTRIAKADVIIYDQFVTSRTNKPFIANI